PTEPALRILPYASAVPYVLLVQPPEGRDWTFTPHHRWWWHFLHREERDRGQDYLEDHFAAGEISVQLHAGDTFTLTAALAGGPRSGAAVEGVGGSADGPAKTAAQPGVQGSASPPGGARAESAEELFETQLRRAAAAFIVSRPIPGQDSGRTVVAGYHWFGDWGRDTFIALPGLALATGRLDECRQMVKTFATYVNQGMLPNRFPDSGAPLNDGDYNTLDASLWYVHAVDALDRLTGGGLVAEVFPTLVEIVDWHIKGTRFGIRVDPADGLVRADDPQLTWMDAKVGDWVCTPRDGKPVEIAALWHHALQLVEIWSRLLGRRTAEARKYAALRVTAADSFGKRFWNRRLGHLNDTIDSARGDDGSLRPNQIIAAALPESPLTAAQRKGVVDTVVSRLWTPRGVRTLDPADPNYRPRYEGDVWSRDGAYHQGTVWPWLLGPLVDAHLAVYNDKKAARQLIAPLADHLFAEGCAGHISEIFDAELPHTPRGAIAQAWSTAELFRAWMNTVH
ncbi:MAG: amylo-alpha-1,6-glucosidase, partial [Chloroflexota bacterium]